MATHSSILAWKVPWMEEPGRLQSMGSLRVRLNDLTFTFHFHALEKEMATYSSILAWKVPWMQEPGGLQSMGTQRVGHDWVTRSTVIRSWVKDHCSYLNTLLISITCTYKSHLSCLYLNSYSRKEYHSKSLINHNTTLGPKPLFLSFPTHLLFQILLYSW